MNLTTNDNTECPNKQTQSSWQMSISKIPGPNRSRDMQVIHSKSDGLHSEEFSSRCRWNRNDLPYSTGRGLGQTNESFMSMMIVTNTNIKIFTPKRFWNLTKFQAAICLTYVLNTMSRYSIKCFWICLKYSDNKTISPHKYLLSITLAVIWEKLLRYFEISFSGCYHIVGFCLILGILFSTENWLKINSNNFCEIFFHVHSPIAWTYKYYQVSQLSHSLKPV